MEMHCAGQQVPCCLVALGYPPWKSFTRLQSRLAPLPPPCHFLSVLAFALRIVDTRSLVQPENIWTTCAATSSTSFCLCSDSRVPSEPSCGLLAVLITLCLNHCSLSWHTQSDSADAAHPSFLKRNTFFYLVGSLWHDGSTRIRHL